MQKPHHNQELFSNHLPGRGVTGSVGLAGTGGTNRGAYEKIPDLKMGRLFIGKAL